MSENSAKIGMAAGTGVLTGVTAFATNSNGIADTNLSAILGSASGTSAKSFEEYRDALTDVGKYKGSAAVGGILQGVGAGVGMYFGGPLGAMLGSTIGGGVNEIINFFAQQNAVERKLYAKHSQEQLDALKTNTQHLDAIGELSRKEKISDYSSEDWKTLSEWETQMMELLTGEGAEEYAKKFLKYRGIDDSDSPVAEAIGQVKGIAANWTSMDTKDRIALYAAATAAEQERSGELETEANSESIYDL